MREFIVEADGGSRGNPGPAGYGSVVIDAASGETLIEAAEYIGVATNNVAEYRGLVPGLAAARELDPDAVVRVRMDSKLVVEQMSGRWKIKHPDMKPLAARAAAVFPSSQVTYEWIPREKNKHADRLANEAMDAGKRGEKWTPPSQVNGGPSKAPGTDGRGPAKDARLEPPGDAVAGAAKARAAMTSAATASARRAADGSSPSASPADGSARRAAADIRAARTLAESGRREPAPAVGWAPSDLGAPATFVLLRHGETPLTPEKRFSGSGGSDPSLSEAGRAQADRAAAALAARGTIQAIVSSPLKRCRETAAAVAARLGLPVDIEDGLREADFGAWEGLSFAEVQQRHPDDLKAWLADPGTAPTGGESFTVVADRVADARDRLLAAHAGRTVLLVTHVTPVKTFVRLALGAPPESLFRMELSAASLSVVAHYPDGNASLRLLNDTGHLR